MKPASDCVKIEPRITTPNLYLTRGGQTCASSQYGFLLWLLVLCLVACDKKPSSHSSVQQDGGLVTLAAKVSQKVVTIEAVGGDGQGVKTGTGFFVSDEGKVATCAHLVEGARSVRVKTLSGAEFIFKGVVSLDRDKDLAILAVASDGASSFGQSNTVVSVGTRIAVLGNPLGFKGTLVDGVVSAFRGGANKIRLIQISAPVSPGSSGSPIVTLTGELVGMVGARAEAGEGIGFALPADYIWKAIGDVTIGKVEEDPSIKALELSRKRYLPSSELWADPEWEKGELPEATSQRLAVLRRLLRKYPSDAIIRVEIAKALGDDGEYDQAFEECAKLVRDDPGNRLAVSELIGFPTDEEQKVPFVKAGVMADPLNFRARTFLFEQEGRDDDFLSAQLSAQRALETAPFSLRISEGYADALLDYELHELAVLDRPFDAFQGDRIRNAIDNSNELRGLIASAALMLSNPSDDVLETFLDLAEGNLSRALPYAWEIMQAGKQGKESVQAVIDGQSGGRLKLLIRDTIVSEPLVAEAYLLDPSAVNVKNGLLIDSVSTTYTKLLSSGAFGVEVPFDQVGMVFLLADASAGGESEPTIQDSESVVRWVAALENYTETSKSLGGIMPQISNMEKGEWRDALIFRFWLATQKERFENEVAKEGVDGDEKEKLEEALKALKVIPTRDDAAQAIRANMRENKLSLWDYFGPEYGMSLESAFEEAAGKR
jgi:hypothetical protein